MISGKGYGEKSYNNGKYIG